MFAPISTSPPAVFSAGKDNINMDDLKKFVSEQPQLRFLGLMLTEACKDDMFQSTELPIVVSGSANEAQVLESLNRYLGRQHYVKKSLSHLFGLTQGYSTPRIEIIQVCWTVFSINDKVSITIKVLTFWYYVFIVFSVISVI
jgi:hypothetical protein